MSADELQKIEKLGDLALRSLLAGEFSVAQEHLGNLDSSPYFREASHERARILLTFYAYVKDRDETVRFVRSNILDLWGAPKLFEIANFMNPRTSRKTKMFKIEFTGAAVSVEGLSSFGGDYVCSFAALATTPREALQYFLHLVPVDDVRCMRVISIHANEVLSDRNVREGIITTLPFRRCSDIERYKKSRLSVASLIPKDCTPDIPVPSVALSALTIEMLTSTSNFNRYGL